VLAVNVNSFGLASEDLRLKFKPHSLRAMEEYDTSSKRPGSWVRDEMCKLRNVVLALLVVQTTAIVLLMRYSRTMARPADAGPIYLASAAVFMAEALKLPYCLLMVARIGGSWRGFTNLLQSEVLGQPAETFKCAVPALAYTIQGNLLFSALSNLDPPTYQVTYQTKTLFTALFSRILLGRTLANSQVGRGFVLAERAVSSKYSHSSWTSDGFPTRLLAVARARAALRRNGARLGPARRGAQLLGRRRLGAPWRRRGAPFTCLPPPPLISQRRRAPVPKAVYRAVFLWVLLVCWLQVLGAAVLSSLSSVYFERMLKRPAKSAVAGAEAAGLWLRNIQLGAFALPLAGLTMLCNDAEQLRSHGLFHGFGPVVWSVVLLNGCGGLLVAATMKYADNIVKCFAAALAIICGMLLSVPIFHLELNPVFLGGAGLTVVATVLYARKPALSWATLGMPTHRGAERGEGAPLCGSSGHSSC